mgnify:CR=1 FL=1
MDRRGVYGTWTGTQNCNAPKLDCLHAIAPVRVVSVEFYEIGGYEVWGHEMGTQLSLSTQDGDSRDGDTAGPSDRDGDTAGPSDPTRIEPR